MKGLSNTVPAALGYLKAKKRYPFARLTAITIAFGLIAASSTATATVIGFTGNPTANYANWAASVSGLGASIDTSVNFDTHPTGLLQGNFYAGLGVTLGFTGDSSTVTTGSGPGQGNNFTPPLSSGEGVHPASNYLFDGRLPSTFTVSFATPVYGAGLHVIDYFNPTGLNPLTIEAFDSLNNSLGLFSSVAYNFQSNNMYFMGITSSAGDISRLVFTDVNSSAGDQTGIDNMVFATGNGLNPVPEPATWLLLGSGLAGLTAFRKRFARK